MGDVTGVESGAVRPVALPVSTPIEGESVRAPSDPAQPDVTWFTTAWGAEPQGAAAVPCLRPLPAARRESQGSPEVGGRAGDPIRSSTTGAWPRRARVPYPSRGPARCSAPPFTSTLDDTAVIPLSPFARAVGMVGPSRLPAARPRGGAGRVESSVVGVTYALEFRAMRHPTLWPLSSGPSACQALPRLSPGRACPCTRARGGWIATTGRTGGRPGGEAGGFMLAIAACTVASPVSLTPGAFHCCTAAGLSKVCTVRAGARRAPCPSNPGLPCVFDVRGGVCMPCTARGLRVRLLPRRIRTRSQPEVGGAGPAPVGARLAVHRPHTHRVGVTPVTRATRPSARLDSWVMTEPLVPT